MQCFTWDSYGFTTYVYTTAQVEQQQSSPLPKEALKPGSQYIANAWWCVSRSIASHQIELISKWCNATRRETHSYAAYSELGLMKSFHVCILFVNNHKRCNSHAIVTAVSNKTRIHKWFALWPTNTIYSLQNIPFIPTLCLSFQMRPFGKIRWSCQKAYFKPWP